MLIHPKSPTSVLSNTTFAPSSLALPVELATSSTPTYASHCGGDPASAMLFSIPPPVPSPTPIMVYVPPVPGIGASSSFQSNNLE